MNKYWQISTFLFVFMLCLSNHSQSYWDEAVEDVKVTAEVVNRFTPSSEDENGDADITMVENKTNIYFDINPDADVSFDVDLLFINTFLSDNGAVLDLPSMLVGRSMRLGVSAPAPFLDDRDWRVGAAAVPTYNTDSWESSFNNFETGAFRWLSESWVEYRGSDRFYIRAGLTYRPEYDYELLPIGEMYYWFSDDWWIRVTSDDFNIVHQFTDRWQIFTEHRYINDEFEITSGSQKGQSIIHQQNTTGIGIQYNFNEKSFLKLSTGMIYNRKFKTLNPTDARADLEDQVYTTLEFTAAF